MEQLATLLTSASTLPESVVLIDGQEHYSQVILCSRRCRIHLRFQVIALAGKTLHMRSVKDHVREKCFAGFYASAGN